MSTTEIPEEVWALIVKHLERPIPKLRTEKWKDLHQRDLASMMRVSKMHFEITAPILYREPIVENVWSFLQSSDLHNPAGASSFASSLVDTADDRPPVQTTKAVCYRYTQRVHVVITESADNFSYSTLLMISSHEDRTRYWNLLTMGAESAKHIYFNDKREAAFHSTNVLHIYQKELHRLYQSTRNTISHQHLRPKGLSFGSYGDLSWNTQQYMIGMDFGHDMIGSSISGIRRAQEESKARREWMEDAISNASIQIRYDWGIFKPQTHCTRLYGGALGMLQQPFLLWQDWDGHKKYPTNGPQTTYIHTDHLRMAPWGITLTATNIIVFHPIESQSYGTSRAIQYIIGEMRNIQTCAEKLVREGTMTAEKLADTTVDIYWPFEVRDGQSGRKEVKEVQERFDRVLETFDRKVRIHQYSQAPACPTCGWCIGDDH